jgi:chitin synthase
VAHVFAGTFNFGKQKKLRPMQVFFVVKQQNKRKLNTHLWFFGGFCKMFNPRFVCLLDVGTGPLKDSLYLLWKAMATNKN